MLLILTAKGKLRGEREGGEDDDDVHQLDQEGSVRFSFSSFPSEIRMIHVCAFLLFGSRARTRMIRARAFVYMLVEVFESDESECWLYNRVI